MVGPGNVKKEIHDMVNMMLINEMRRRKGLKNPVVSRHLVFTGNPGTGKTTIARAIGKIYKTLGILEKGHMIETDRAGMVAGYMGQTAEKVTDVVKQAMGGILFIDEAYSLVTESEGDFGQEAINTLLKLMEDNRDNLVVIVAGYTEEMQDFINSNPGLRSRFNRYIQFNDYSDEELLQIFKAYVDEQDYILEEGTDETVLEAVKNIRSSEGENFGNARSMRNYFEKVISHQANRLIDVSSMSFSGGDDDELMKIKKEDLVM
jgi:SpoVK/Ycf46/Vps4 family AAA+-type ATPase